MIVFELVVALFAFLGAAACASFVSRFGIQDAISSSFGRSFSSSQNKEPLKYVYEASSFGPVRELDRRKRKDQLKVTTYNLEYLVHPKAVEEGRVHPTTPYPDADSALEKILRIAKKLARLDSDVFVLQEVQNIETLYLLREFLPHGHAYDAFLIENLKDPLMMNTALLTRISPKGPVTTVEEVLNEPLESGIDSGAHLRRSIICDLPLGDGRDVCLIGVHLPSLQRQTEEAQERRQQQAKRLFKQVWQAKHDDKLVLVAGDFNDADQEVLGVRVPYYFNPQVIKRIKGLFLVNAAARGLLSDGQLFSTHQEHLVDHLLVDKELELKEFHIDNSFRVDVSDHYPVSGIFHTGTRKE